MPLVKSIGRKKLKILIVFVVHLIYGGKNILSKKRGE
jgi:hypothetical protein